MPPPPVWIRHGVCLLAGDELKTAVRGGNSWRQVHAAGRGPHGRDNDDLLMSFMPPIGRDNTVGSRPVSVGPWRLDLDSRRPETVGERKFDNWTCSESLETTGFAA